MSESLPEPWLRGILPGFDAVTGHLLRASAHIREDVDHALRPLSVAQIWAMPEEMTSAGFHAKHLAGSTRRLCSYLEGRQLTPDELAEIPRERAGSEDAAQLVKQVSDAFDRYEDAVRALKPEAFGGLREIGRKRLRVTAIGLAIHIAEHGQRHTGQLISASKLARATVAS